MPTSIQTTTQSAFARSPQRKIGQLGALKRALPSGRPLVGVGQLRNMGVVGR